MAIAIPQNGKAYVQSPSLSLPWSLAKPCNELVACLTGEARGRVNNLWRLALWERNHLLSSQIGTKCTRYAESVGNEAIGSHRS